MGSGTSRSCLWKTGILVMTSRLLCHFSYKIIWWSFYKHPRRWMMFLMKILLKYLSYKNSYLNLRVVNKDVLLLNLLPDMMSCKHTYAKDDIKLQKTSSTQIGQNYILSCEGDIHKSHGTNEEEDFLCEPTEWKMVVSVWTSGIFINDAAQAMSLLSIVVSPSHE